MLTMKIRDAGIELIFFFLLQFDIHLANLFLLQCILVLLSETGFKCRLL